MDFCRRKFAGMLGTATLMMAVAFIVVLSDTLIVGNLVGEAGIAGVSTVVPVISFAACLGCLIGCGAVLMFTKAMGAFDERRAHEVFSLSLTFAVALGLALALAMAFGRDAFLDLMGVTGEIRTQALAYWKWEAVVVPLTPLVFLLKMLVYSDGDETVSNGAVLLQIVSNILLSIFLVRRLGTVEGASLGTFATTLALLAVLSTHFFRRANHLVLTRSFRFSLLGEMLKLSLTDAAVYFCWGALLAVENKFTVVCFGEEYLPLVALCANAMEFSIVFDGVGEGLTPIGGMYAGERNGPALRSLARHAARVALAEGVVFGGVLFACAPFVPRLYGIGGTLMPGAVRLVRIVALGMPIMAVLMMATSQFLVMGAVKLALTTSVLKDFLFPAALTMAFGLAAGPDQMWWGLPASFVLSLAVVFGWIRVRYARARFPWLVWPSDGSVRNFALGPAADGISRLGADVQAFLVARGHPAAVSARAARLVSGVAEFVRRWNSARGVSLECSVFDDRAGVKIVVRDAGRHFGLGDLQREAGASLEGVGARYLNTLNSNRLAFTIG